MGVFFDTLIDENAASHIALGMAYRLALDEERDRERANPSTIHIDSGIATNSRNTCWRRGGYTSVHGEDSGGAQAAPASTTHSA